MCPFIKNIDVEEGLVDPTLGYVDVLVDVGGYFSPI
jgi:hypothetical protein